MSKILENLSDNQLDKATLQCSRFMVRTRPSEKKYFIMNWTLITTKIYSSEINVLSAPSIKYYFLSFSWFPVIKFLKLV